MTQKWLVFGELDLDIVQLGKVFECRREDLAKEIAKYLTDWDYYKEGGETVEVAFDVNLVKFASYPYTLDYAGELYQRIFVVPYNQRLDLTDEVEAEVQELCITIDNEYNNERNENIMVEYEAQN